jgi:NO-binding membrane sensor protein with MHYT domain
MNAGLTRRKWPSRVVIQKRSSERAKKGSTGMGFGLAKMEYHGMGVVGYG